MMMRMNIRILISNYPLSFRVQFLVKFMLNSLKKDRYQLN
jgi:hypothetical protein